MKNIKKVVGLWVTIFTVFVSQVITYGATNQNASLIWPNPGAINVTKLAEPLDVVAKDEWQITLKIEGKNIEIEDNTDVVLLLDRSGSMEDKVEGNTTRAQKAKEASKKFIDALLVNNVDKVRASIVSFGGYSKSNTWYIDTTVNSNFTSSKTQLNQAIDTALKTPSGGTPMKEGIAKAGEVLKSSTAKNKIMILLTDGSPTGNSSYLDVAKMDATIAAANKVKNEIPAIKLYTIGVGTDKLDNSDKIYLKNSDNPAYNEKKSNYTMRTGAEKTLRDCQNSGYFSVSDTGEALQNIMNSIAREIAYAATAAQVIDPIGLNFNLRTIAANGSPKLGTLATLSADSKNIFDYTGKDLDIVVSQGDISYTDGKIQWQIGQVSESAPAVLKYRVKMKNTTLGGLHETNGLTSLTYKDAYGKDGIKSSDRTDEHGFKVPAVAVGAGSIRVVGYAAKLEGGRWVPINKNGIPVERPDLGNILYNELYQYNNKTILSFGTYTILPVDNLEGYKYVQGVQNTSVTIGQNEPTKIIYLPYKANENIPIDLMATPNHAANYIDLKWNAPNTSTFYNYTVFRKDQNSEEFQSVSSIDIDTYKEEGKKVKVLNIYPTNGVDKIAYKGGQILKSANLKVWMEDAQSGAPEGYGKGVLAIEPVSITDFNENPSIIDGYDVVYVGHWDSNANQGLTSDALRALEAFINAGKGLLVGHDTTAADILDSGNQYSLGSTEAFRNKFNIKTGYSSSSNGAGLAAAKQIDFNKNFNWGGDKIEIAKTGALMNYPWIIKNPLTIPYTHTAAQIAYGDVWFTFKDGEWFNGRSTPPDAADVGNGAVNFYLTTWNNIGIIQTGHSKGEATSDEQKILANVLFNLAQKTTDTKLTDKGGQDITPPTQSQIKEVKISSDNKVKVKFEKSEDQGTKYIYKVKAADINNAAVTIESQEAEAMIKVGLKGYIAIASNNANLTDSDLKAMKANEQGIVSVDAGASAEALEVTAANLNLNAPVYVYLSSVDQANNVSEPYKYNYNPQALVLNSTQHEENTGAKWVELNWTKPEWLGDYKLYRDDEYISGSSGSTYNDKNDKINPNAPEDISVTYNNGKISTEFLPAEDVEGSYTYKVSASNKGEFYEATASGAVMSGIKGYKISVDNNPNTVPTGEVLENLTKTGDKLQWVSGNLGSGFNTGNAYVHIIAVDNSGNTSQPVHMKVSVGYPEVALTVMNPISNKQVLAPYIVETTGPNYKEKILAPAVIVGKEEEIALKIKINKLENQKYQFIKVSEEEVKPNFPAADDNKWIDINRFKYSYQVGEGPWSTMKETTTGNTDGEQYDRIEVNAGLGMPDEAGKYYVAVKVQQAGGNPPREVLYGPFKVEGSILPNVYTKPPKSFTQPEGYSNIEYDASFDTDFKEVKITLDMSKLVDAHIVENTPIVFYKIGEAILTIKKGKKGGPAYATQVIRVGGQTSGDYEVSTDDNEIVIKLTNEVKAEDEYIISVLIPTKFGEVKYGPEGAARTYLTFIKQINEGEIAQAIVEAIVEGYPKLLEAEADEPAVFRSEPVTASESKVVTYLPLPKIN